MRGFGRWKWRLHEMYVKINGEMHYLWRAVDYEGEILRKTEFDDVDRYHSRA